MTEHTPTPWAADPDDREGYEWNVHIVEDAQPHMRVCFMSNGPDSEANAAFIVKAVNNHDALLRRVTVLETVIRQDLSPFDCSDDLNKMIVEDIHKRFSVHVGSSGSTDR